MTEQTLSKTVNNDHLPSLEYENCMLKDLIGALESEYIIYMNLRHTKSITLLMLKHCRNVLLQSKDGCLQINSSEIQIKLSLCLPIPAILTFICNWFSQNVKRLQKAVKIAHEISVGGACCFATLAMGPRWAETLLRDLHYVGGVGDFAALLYGRRRAVARTWGLYWIGGVVDLARVGVSRRHTGRGRGRARCCFLLLA